jgi:HEAT repeat protein
MAAIGDAVVALVSVPMAGADAAVERLVSGLSGSREGYRVATARILGRVGRADDESVIGLLLSDPSPVVRRAAVEDLIELAEERVAEPLCLALADDAPEVRTAAAAALATRRDEDALAHLSALTADPHPAVRAAAIRAAGRRLAGGADPTERVAALKLFEHALSDEGAVAMALAEALSKAGGRDCAGLALRLFERPEPELIRAAIACVGRHGDPPTLEQLLPLLAHEAWSVRAEAVRWLAERGVARSLPAILRRLDLEQDPFVREAILAALRRLES